MTSKIEWTDVTWNPVRGCTKVSAGCDNCYAERFAERWRGVKGHAYEQGFDLRLVPEKLEEPLKWKKPRMVFVNSMSDLFHKDIPRDFIGKVFDVMEEADRHVFQVLTKRSSLMAQFIRDRYYNSRNGWHVPKHIWLGVSVEDRRALARVNHLWALTPWLSGGGVAFLSCEPLLEDLGEIPGLDALNWVIVGGESGPNARPMKEAWVRRLRDDCKEEGVPFFFKQWGGKTPKANGRLLDGREWNEMPL